MLCILEIELSHVKYLILMQIDASYARESHTIQSYFFDISEIHGGGDPTQKQSGPPVVSCLVF